MTTDPAETALAAITAAGGQATAVRADVSQVSQINAMFDTIAADLGHVDVLVNNAGVSTFEPFFEITEAIWDNMHSVNLRGAFFCSQRAARMMVDRGQGGRIVSISSISAHVGGVMEVAYCPTKSGIRSLMHSLCLVLGPHGITCNSVSPGTIATEAVQRQMALAPSGACWIFAMSRRDPGRAAWSPGRGRRGGGIPRLAGGQLHQRCRDPGRRRSPGQPGIAQRPDYFSTPSE